MTKRLKHFIKKSYKNKKGEYIKHSKLILQSQHMPWNSMFHLENLNKS